MALSSYGAGLSACWASTGPLTPRHSPSKPCFSFFNPLSLADHNALSSLHQQQGRSLSCTRLNVLKESDVDVENPAKSLPSAQITQTDGWLSQLEQLWSEEPSRIALLTAVAYVAGAIALSASVVYFRATWKLQGDEVPLTEIIASFAIAVAATVGMEYWSQWNHKALWHDSLWFVHEEYSNSMTSLFSSMFVPALGLLTYGLYNQGMGPGLCFGAGVGISIYGVALMFVHDGIGHRRFPIGPIANLPYLQRVAAAHQIHHADKFGGVPYGFFLGPKEVAEVGGTEQLEKLVEMRKRGKMPVKIPASKEDAML